MFEPNFLLGGSLTEEATLPAAAFTGSLNVVTAKATASNQELTSSFTTTTGAIAANMLLVNSTHSSVAIVRKSLGGGVWQIDQPLVPYVDGTFPLPTVTNVDTWAHSDTITGYVPREENIVKIGGYAIDYNPISFPPTHVVQNLTIFDPNGVGASDTVFVANGSAPLLYNCVVERLAGVNGYGIANQGFSINTAYRSFMRIDVGDYNGFDVAGGHFENNATFKTGGMLFGGVTVGTGVTLELGKISAGVGQIFLEGTAQALFLDNVQMNGGDAFYGAGSMNWVSGTTLYVGAPFPASGGMKVNSLTTAYSYATSAGTTTIHNLTLNPANLAASAGASGFGGTAWGPGTVITSGAQP
jgi:hypothetical protein